MNKIVLLFMSLLLFNSCKNDNSNPVFAALPPVPVLSSPIDGATNQSTEPTLSWNASIGAISYTLQVSVNNTFTSYVYDQSGLTETSQPVTGLSNNTKYYWRVNATNSAGTSEWSNSSSPWSFTTIGTAPPAPTLSTPANNAINVAMPPALTWNASTGAVSYTIQVSTSSAFVGFIYTQSGLSGTSHQVSGLSNNTKYYWRVSATNSIGTSSWSNVRNFTTAAPSFNCGTNTISYSGKTYNTIQIGNQCWLKENLNVGTRINSSQLQANNNTIEKYCFGNLESNCTTYGGFYQWEEAVAYSTTPGTQGICPSGWHIPTLAEFQVLSATVNNNSNPLKSVGQGTGNGAGTNTSGFSALLAGARYDVGTFGDLDEIATFWSSTESNSDIAHRLFLRSGTSNIYLTTSYEDYGFSIRCLKD